MRFICTVAAAVALGVASAGSANAELTKKTLFTAQQAREQVGQGFNFGPNDEGLVQLADGRVLFGNWNVVYQVNVERQKIEPFAGKRNAFGGYTFDLSSDPRQSDFGKVFSLSAMRDDTVLIGLRHHLMAIDGRTGKLSLPIGRGSFDLTYDQRLNHAIQDVNSIRSTRDLGDDRVMVGNESCAVIWDTRNGGLMPVLGDDSISKRNAGDRFLEAWGIADVGGGAAVFSDFNRGRLCRYDPGSRKASFFAGNNSPESSRHEQPIESAKTVEALPDGSLAVLSTGHTQPASVIRVSADGSTVTPLWSSPPQPDLGLYGPTAIHARPDGTILAIDNSTQSLVELSEERQ